MKLVTHQTGPEGREVKTLLIEEGLPIDHEFYLGIMLDRVTGRNVFMASSAGGMDIEEVAEETPELILKETIDPSVGLARFSGAQARLWSRHSERSDQPGREVHALALRRVREDGRVARRDQSVPADERQSPDRARRKGQL